MTVNLNFTPIKQKHRKFAADRDWIINEEVRKLLDAEFVREIKYFDWLANVVVVQKKIEKWCICINFSDLNREIPKDSFPATQHRQTRGATAGDELLFFGTLNLDSPWVLVLGLTPNPVHLKP